MSLLAGLTRFAPDLAETGRRFAFPILLAALATAMGLYLINGPAQPQGEAAERLWIGLATGAVWAVAGVYFTESWAGPAVGRVAVAYLLPLAVVAMFQVRSVDYFIPWLLPVIGVLWLSVSPFTAIGRNGERDSQQDRFWWINHQAVVSAAIAALGFLVIALGLAAIERSLALLFGLSAGDFLYRWVLPLTGMFLTPVYWLSTLPPVSRYSDEWRAKPEFTATAVGLLGQFVLVPLLLIYGAILLAYTAQILLTWQLPQGMIGWMVLGFVVIGAAAWLVLYPPFLRDRPLVRLFRRVWFWLTLLPLALFFYAVWVRLDAYGLTSERLLLLAGGVWALALAVSFLARLGDIRLIPGLAALILIALSIGPWNVANLPLAQHAARLEALLAMPGQDGASFPPVWTPAEVEEAGASMSYLAYNPFGEERLQIVLARFGLSHDPLTGAIPSVMRQLGYEWPVGSASGFTTYVALRWDPASLAIEVEATPWLIGTITTYRTGPATDGPVALALLEDRLEARAGGMSTAIDLGVWTARQQMTQGGELAQPWLDFSVGDTNYRLVVMSADFEVDAEGGVAPYNLYGQLFSSRPPTPTP